MIILLRRLLLYPLLVASGCHLLLTGSPVPFWHMEVLKNPVTVAVVRTDVMVLDNGRNVTLPLIREIPADHPMFLAALEHGVEVAEEGELYGLLSVKRACGNDPTIYYRKRINLSELAALLHPQGIDKRMVHPDEVALISEQDVDEREPPLSMYAFSQLRYPRQVFSQARRLGDSDDNDRFR